jgi:hypothetical protein
VQEKHPERVVYKLHMEKQTNLTAEEAPTRKITIREGGQGN